MRFKEYIPFFDWISDYSGSTFRSDFIAGITVAIMLVPQGMAYAFLAGMPPIYGLYGGLIPLILYAILGTSRQMSIGPVAISALLVLAGVSKLADPGTPEYIQLVILAGLLIGAAQVILGLLKMGQLVNFLSHPVVIGFTSAAAIIIAISQLKDLMGIEIPRMENSFETLLYAIEHMGEANIWSVGICIGSIIVMIGLRKIRRSFPSALFVVAVGTILAYFLNLESHGLKVIGKVPEGLPFFDLPNITIENIKALLPTVFTVTIIGIVESIGIAKVLESKHQSYVVRPDQELLALGISKIGGAFFQALPTSGSFTRSAINNDSGARTGMASIITAVLVALTLILLTPLFFYLPKAVLAAIIIIAVRSLFDMKEAVHLWKVHRQDFVMMLVTFVVTLVLGIEEGVVAGVLLSILAVLYRSSKPHMAVLGHLPGTTDYRNINRFEDVKEADDILIFRFDNQLYFANTSYFKDSVRTLVRQKHESLKLVILDAKSLSDIDSSGLHGLDEVITYLHKQNIEFNLCGAIGPVRDMLHKSGLMKLIGEKNQFINIHDAILQYESEEGIEGLSTHAIQSNID